MKCVLGSPARDRASRERAGCRDRVSRGGDCVGKSRYGRGRGPVPSAAGASPSAGTALSQGRGRAAKDRSSAKPRAAGTQAGPSYSSKLHAWQEKSPLQSRRGGQKHLVTMKNLPSPFLVPQQPERSWNEDSAMALEMKRMI